MQTTLTQKRFAQSKENSAHHSDPVLTKVTVAKGDGIGPEIMAATRAVLTAAKAPIEWEEIEVGEQVYLSGNTSGIGEKAWESIRANKVFLKAPITTPRGDGYKSLNVTMRKTLGLFANVRPCLSYAPFVDTKHPHMDVVIIRENEEDLYAGIEHQQTDEVVQCLKLITRPGCEKIIRYAFEYAKLYKRKKVSCFVKDNIMKHTDGLFHSVFKEIAAEYPEIEHDSWIVDIGAARIADTPEAFDVVVMPNLYGDIISDITAQISGSVGLAGSANIGQEVAMFEAIHGSAPLIAGKNIANPSGLLKAAVLMLNHIGASKTAQEIENAWLCTIEDGIHTEDIYTPGVSTQLVGTDAFAQAIIERLGRTPKQLSPAQLASGKGIKLPAYQRRAPQAKTLDGVDVFVDWKGNDAAQLAEQLQKLYGTLTLQLITNRGVKVWPNGFDETFCTDHWRCRFQADNAKASDIYKLLESADALGIDIIKTENLYRFNQQRGYSLGQGQ
jgi:isocitrate dehydrogenase